MRGGIARVGAGGSAGGNLIGGSGGGGVGISNSINAKITGFTANGERLLAKMLDGTGSPSGDEMEVRVRTVGQTIGSMDIYMVQNNTIPSLNVGQFILIVQATVWDGTQFVTDWWTFDQYAVRGCG